MRKQRQLAMLKSVFARLGFSKAEDYWRECCDFVTADELAEVLFGKGKR